MRSTDCRICGRDNFTGDHSQCDEIIRIASRPYLIPAGIPRDQAERDRIEWARQQVTGRS